MAWQMEGWRRALAKVSLHLRAEAYLESAQCSDWGGREESSAHARGQPRAQMDPAGG